MLDLLTRLAVEHVVMPVVLSLITALVGWIAVRWHQWTGRQMEASLRDGLHSALESAARLIIERYGEANIDHDAAAAHDALEYVRESVPEAVRHFRLGQGQLLDMIRSKLPLFGV